MNNMEKRKNHTQYRYYIKGNLELLSPLIIASGEDEFADLQLIRDWDGNIIISGTTLAGNIRHLLQEKIKDKKLIDRYLGTDDETSGHSLVSFFDASTIDVNTDIRDGVELDNLTKTAKDKSKYDYEIINTGSTFELRIKALSRESSDNKIIEAILSEIIALLEKSELRIGAKTSRGFGRIKLTQTKTLKLAMDKEEDRKKWIDFSWGDLDEQNKFEVKDDLFDQINNFKMSAQFTILDSLIIKSYSTNPDAVDSVSLTSNNTPVVPGTSWVGAIRHALENVGREINKHDEISELIRETFGCVGNQNNNSLNAIPSKVIIDESIITNSTMIPYVRNKVDRFTGGVVESALFDEESVYGGSVRLDCEIKNAEDHEIGMLILAIKELQNGIQTVGGGSSIGRGRLKEKKRVDISDEDQKKYLNALAKKLNSIKLNGKDNKQLNCN